MNTNLTEQPRPYTHSQLKRLGRVKATRRPPTNATVTISTVVSSPGKKPRLQTHVIPVEHKGRTKRRVKAYRIETTIVGDVLHGRSLPEAGPAIRLKSAKAAARNAKDDETPLRSYRPEYLDLTYLPATFPRPKTRAPRKKPKYPPLRGLNLYQPDRRQLLTDLSYPWSTVGRVETNSSTATGVLIGPRHVLSCSHDLPWDLYNSGQGWFKFTPAFSNGNAPFGWAWATDLYFYREVGHADGELEVSEDYVVAALTERLGDTLGYMGARVYSNDWDDHPYWINIGYGAQEGLFSGSEPHIQDQVSFEDADNPGLFGQEGDGLYMDTESASLTHGDSGGPFFAFWDDGPYVVGVVSAQGTISFDDDNWAGGGRPMVRTVRSARAQSP